MACVRRKIAVAMSGGVDSSVAAYLLAQDPNNEVVALHMSNWDSQDEEDAPKGCVEQDVKDAETVCRHLSLPLHKASFAAEYWTQVFEPFVDGIASGRTPNPDIGCNAYVKFGAMKQYAHDRLGVDWIATGHYARLWNRKTESTMPEHVVEALDQHSWLYEWGDNNPLLLAGVDKSKDQSYFLAGTKGANFRNVAFPLGDWLKTGADKTVRRVAEEAQLPTATKRDSMGICFVGKRDFGSFISQYLPSVPPPGNFVDVDTGVVIGRHKGALHYTIGQGAKIPGASRKWFVVGRAEGDFNAILVCGDTHHPALYSGEMIIHDMTWIGGDIPALLTSSGRLKCQCRTRHLQPLADSEIELKDGQYTVRLERPLRGITPGQMAAFYLGDVCLGGGTIIGKTASYHDLGLELPEMLHPAGHNDTSVANR